MRAALRSAAARRPVTGILLIAAAVALAACGTGTAQDTTGAENSHTLTSNPATLAAASHSTPPPTGSAATSGATSGMATTSPTPQLLSPTAGHAAEAAAAPGYQDDGSALNGLSGGQQVDGAATQEQPLADGTLGLGTDNCLYIVQSGYWVPRGVCDVTDPATGYVYVYVQGQPSSSWFAAVDTDPLVTDDGTYTVTFVRQIGLWVRYPTAAAGQPALDVDDDGQWVSVDSYEQGLQQEIAAEQQQIADQSNTVAITCAPFTIEAQGGTSAQGAAAAIAIQEATNSFSVYETEGDLGNSLCTVVDQDDGDC